MLDSPDPISSISSISHLDVESIEFLIDCMSHPSLEVRWKAYDRLQSFSSDLDLIPAELQQKIGEIIALGILLNPGDIVWSVYRSGLSYTDEDFIVYDLTDYSGEATYCEEVDPSIYELFNRGFLPKLISIHTNRVSAESAAKAEMKRLISEHEYYYLNNFSYDLETKISQQDIYDRAKSYCLPDLPLPTHPEFNWNDNLSWGGTEEEERIYEEYRYELYNYKQLLRDYAVDVLEKLTVDEHYELIEWIYINVVGRLACVRAETVRESTYFVP